MTSPLSPNLAKCFQNKNASGDLRFMLSDLRFAQLQMRSRSGNLRVRAIFFECPRLASGDFHFRRSKVVERVDLRILIQKIARAK